MPRVKVRVPAELLTAADERAEALGCNLSEALFERSEKVAKRQRKQRHVMYTDALLPSGAGRPT